MRDSPFLWHILDENKFQSGSGKASSLLFLESGSGKASWKSLRGRLWSLEYMCRTTGEVTCEMCEFLGFSFKELTTHFRSDEHLEEVSYRVPRPKGNETESETETETEHVVEEEEHQMCAKERA
ncbi:hypothetical protein HA466_0315650 [Hirschfeldia incana]|nr:hypothetical protein HA466_0315650 [Hirschfeldia incana]